MEDHLLYIFVALLGEIPYEADFRCFLGDELTADIGSSDDDGVLEAYRTPLRVGKPSVVENLQQDVEDVRVGFFKLVEEDHRIRIAANFFGKLSSFTVAHIAGRRPDQFGACVTLHEFGHVQTDEFVFVVKEKFGKGFGQLRLAHSRGTQKEEGSDGPILLLQARPVAPDGIAHGFDGVVLTNDALVQVFLHAREFFCLGLEHPGYRDARLMRDNPCNVFLVHGGFLGLNGLAPARTLGL